MEPLLIFLRFHLKKPEDNVFSNAGFQKQESKPGVVVPYICHGTAIGKFRYKEAYSCKSSGCKKLLENFRISVVCNLGVSFRWPLPLFFSIEGICDFYFAFSRTPFPL